MFITGKNFNFPSQVHLIGILNVTPDSFSDGGRFQEPGAALDQAMRLQEEGASLIDIGGESTRPGSQAVSEEEELNRILPVIRKIRPHLKIPISIDTQKASVAKVALQEGVDLVNDVCAMRDPEMVKVVATAKVPIILMHMRGTPETMQEGVFYTDVIEEILVFFRERIQVAREAGIGEDKILIDPGIGFGKRVEDNQRIFEGLNRFSVLGCPIVFGASRKSFVKAMYGESPEEILRGSVAMAVKASSRGASLLRVHDVKETAQALKTMAE